MYFLDLSKKLLQMLSFLKIPILCYKTSSKSSRRVLYLPLLRYIDRRRFIVQTALQKFGFFRVRKMEKIVPVDKLSNLQGNKVPMLQFGACWLSLDLYLRLFLGKREVSLVVHNFEKRILSILNKLQFSTFGHLEARREVIYGY